MQPITIIMPREAKLDQLARSITNDIQSLWAQSQAVGRYCFKSLPASC